MENTVEKSRIKKEPQTTTRLLAAPLQMMRTAYIDAADLYRRKATQKGFFNKFPPRQKVKRHRGNQTPSMP